MYKLCMVQLKKLFFRADSKWIIAVFTVLPFGIAYLVSIESGVVQIGNSVFTAMGYSSVVVGLFSGLLLIGVTVALATSSFVSKEIDTGLDGMYVSKVESRGQIIVSKMIALDVFLVSIFAALVLSSTVGWLVFLKDSPFGCGAFLSQNNDRDEVFTLVYTLLGSFFEIFVMVRIYTLFSLLFKYGKALVINFVTIVAFKLLANIEQVKLWMPSYIGSGEHLLEYTGKVLFYNGLLSIELLALYAVIFSLLNYFIYKRMDLSR